MDFKLIWRKRLPEEQKSLDRNQENPQIIWSDSSVGRACV